MKIILFNFLWDSADAAPKTVKLENVAPAMEETTEFV